MSLFIFTFVSLILSGFCFTNNYPCSQYDSDTYKCMGTEYCYYDGSYCQRDDCLRAVSGTTLEEATTQCQAIKPECVAVGIEDTSGVLDTTTCQYPASKYYCSRNPWSLSSCALEFVVNDTCDFASGHCAFKNGYCGWFEDYCNELSLANCKMDPSCHIISGKCVTDSCYDTIYDFETRSCSIGCTAHPYYTSFGGVATTTVQVCTSPDNDHPDKCVGINIYDSPAPGSCDWVPVPAWCTDVSGCSTHTDSDGNTYCSDGRTYTDDTSYYSSCYKKSSNQSACIGVGYCFFDDDNRICREDTCVRAATATTDCGEGCELKYRTYDYDCDGSQVNKTDFYCIGSARSSLLITSCFYEGLKTGNCPSSTSATTTSPAEKCISRTEDGQSYCAFDVNYQNDSCNDYSVEMCDFVNWCYVKDNVCVTDPCYEPLTGGVSTCHNTQDRCVQKEMYRGSYSEQYGASYSSSKYCFHPDNNPNPCEGLNGYYHVSIGGSVYCYNTYYKDDICPHQDGCSIITAPDGDKYCSDGRQPPSPSSALVTKAPSSLSLLTLTGLAVLALTLVFGV